jgi:hypothetical protein
MMDDPIPQEFITDNLMLLIGTNPLPNYVTAKLLANQNTRLHLLVTDEIIKADIHKRLVKLLGREMEDESQYLPVPSSNPQEILHLVAERILLCQGSWGLNYTGGKKSMSTHAYQAMEQTMAARKQKCVYSYLDADTLKLIINYADQQISPYVHTYVKVTIQTILEMHGRGLHGYHENPFHPEVGATLVEFSQDHCNREKWREWANSNLKRPDGGDLNQTQAKSIRITENAPALIAGKTLDELCSEWNQIKNPAEIAKWLHGSWLDDYIHAEAKIAAETTEIHQVVSSLKPKGLSEFEVDVVAMQGYRLFAISATTDDEKGLAKLKLFEVMVRARQMGGDEAKIALVTFSDNPKVIEKQAAEKFTLLRSDRRITPVRVFGIKDLPDLATHLEIWFKEV